MKYLCIVYGEEKKMAEVDDRDCLACGTSLRQNGKLVAAEALQPVRTAKTVRVRDGKVSVTDGLTLSTPRISTTRSMSPRRSHRRAWEASRFGRLGS
jgi:hypothetical protein